ncbi:MAG: prepilin-type N-terminal cleavage/methylation domain-containing protein [Dehalococcoidia bacterium]|nr:prepilin-type N-terminal cleavage/methylation domain-containing protein [Dehalococcoidia bacterium]
MKIPKRGEKGFTLIELLIVAAILGLTGRFLMLMTPHPTRLP